MPNEIKISEVRDIGIALALIGIDDNGDEKVSEKEAGNFFKNVPVNMQPLSQKPAWIASPREFLKVSEYLGSRFPSLGTKYKDALSHLQRWFEATATPDKKDDRKAIEALKKYYREVAPDTMPSDLQLFLEGVLPFFGINIQHDFLGAVPFDIPSHQAVNLDPEKPTPLKPYNIVRLPHGNFAYTPTYYISPDILPKSPIHILGSDLACYVLADERGLFVKILSSNGSIACNLLVDPEHPSYPNLKAMIQQESSYNDLIQRARIIIPELLNEMGIQIGS